MIRTTRPRPAHSPITRPRRRPRLLLPVALACVTLVTGGAISATALVSAQRATAPVQTAPPPARHDLGPGQALTTGRSLTYGAFAMEMEPDGDLVVSGPPGPARREIWSTGTSGHPGARAVMQPDGNFVVVDARGRPLWSTGTAGQAGSCLMGGSLLGSMVVESPLRYAWFGGAQWPMWSVAPCYLGAAGAPKVAIVGDSITYIGEEDGALAAALDGRYAYQASGMIGYTFAEQLPALRSVLDDPAGPPRDVVINLGTNDSLTANAGWRRGFRALARAVGDRCTLLVTVARTADRKGNLADRINATERSWVDRHRNFHLVPWAAMLRDAGYAQLGTDRIHPTPAGEAELADAYARALRRDCGP
jgi:lysophospholipase L1-like esterase